MQWNGIERAKQLSRQVELDFTDEGKRLALRWHESHTIFNELMTIYYSDLAIYT